MAESYLFKARKILPTSLVKQTEKRKRDHSWPPQYIGNSLDKKNRFVNSFLTLPAESTESTAKVDRKHSES